MSEIHDSFYNMPAGCHRADGLTDADDQEQAIRETEDFEVRVRERFGDAIDMLVRYALSFRTDQMQLESLDQELLKLWDQAEADEIESQMRGGTI